MVSMVTFDSVVICGGGQFSSDQVANEPYFLSVHTYIIDSMV